MTVDRLTIRGLMAYGLACLSAYLKHHNMDFREYEDEIKILSSYTQSNNLSQWNDDVKSFLFNKYSDDDCASGVPRIFECLYYVGTADMYGAYSGDSVAELSCITDMLNKESISLPNIERFTPYILNKPNRDDDYFGNTFVCPDYFS